MGSKYSHVRDYQRLLSLYFFLLHEGFWARRSSLGMGWALYMVSRACLADTLQAQGETPYYKSWGILGEEGLN